jgi:hypothetical protein
MRPTGGLRRSQGPAEDVVRQRPNEFRQHVLDGRDSSHRLRAERPAVRVRADHLPVDEDRTSAHACHDLGDLEPRMAGLDQDQVLARPEVAQDIDHLDVETLRTRPFEDGKAIPLHPGLDVLYRHHVSSERLGPCLHSTAHHRDRGHQPA